MSQPFYWHPEDANHILDSALNVTSGIPPTGFAAQLTKPPTELRYHAGTLRTRQRKRPWARTFGVTRRWLSCFMKMSHQLGEARPLFELKAAEGIQAVLHEPLMLSSHLNHTPFSTAQVWEYSQEVRVKMWRGLGDDV